MMIQPSKKSLRTTNPIRNIVDNLKRPENHALPMMNLGLGDPTVYGNLCCPPVLIDSVKQSLSDPSANGYIASVGSLPARKAIAEYSRFTKQEECAGEQTSFPVSEDDVIIASGCSGAIDLVLTALLNEGDNILVPSPCFPLYQVIAESLGASVKHYQLKPEAQWECDLVSMEAQIDENTKAIFMNNPSNPCGSNFSPEHLSAIAAVAIKHGLLIIADEIYGGCVFKGTFSPMHAYSGSAPVVSLGGLAKEFVVPGWRLGWIVVHDKGTGRLTELKKGIISLTQIVLGANSLIQSAIPRVLTPAAGSEDKLKMDEFKTNYMSVLDANAKLCVSLGETCPELTVIEPDGAMYAMIGIDIASLDDAIDDDASFATQLLTEQNLFVLPGQCFGMKNYIRLVTCCPQEIIQEAFERLVAFCIAHRVSPIPPPAPAPTGSPATAAGK